MECGNAGSLKEDQRTDHHRRKYRIGDSGDSRRFVRLGIKAPREVSVVRHELREKLVSDSLERVNTSMLQCMAWSKRSDLVDV